MNSFKDIHLSQPIALALEEMGFQTPTPIQAQAVPILLGESTDFLGLAATGTGKTVAFSVPMLERIDTSKRSVQGLVLCPTRELAIQVAKQIDLLGKHLGVRALPIYGGASYSDQMKGLKKGTAVVVGTPGRVVDHIERGTLDLSEIETVVLDEADEMISMGFKDDLEAILSQTPRENSKIWFFCATMSKEVRRVTERYLRNPKRVEVNRKEMVPEAIEQIFYKAHESDKPEILCKLLDAAVDVYGIIFCQTKALVVDLTQYLHGRGYTVDCLHGDMDQGARERTMQAFRNKKVKLLVCTDVASRGLDVKDVTHVINYSLPVESEVYVHRIGRTARSGKTGFALSLIAPGQKFLLARIENETKSRIREGKLPTRKEIGAKKISSMLPKFLAQKEVYARAIDLMDGDWKQAIAEMSKEEIVGRFLAQSFPEVFEERPETRDPVAPTKVADVGMRRGDAAHHYRRRHERKGQGQGHGKGGRNHGGHGRDHGWGKHR